MTDVQSRGDRSTTGGLGNLSLMEVLALLLRRRRLVAAIPLVLGFLVVVTGLFAARTWSASATFYPQSSPSGLGRLGGLAAQFGLNVPGGGDTPEQSPDFYVSLVKSESLLREVARSSFRYVENGVEKEATLIDIYKLDLPSEALNVAAAVKQLQDDITARTDIKTGVVGLTVRAPTPELSVELTDRLLLEINKFNLEARQTRASAEATFVGTRLESVRQDLRHAEGALQAFLTRNRTFRDSPELQFENDRLKREVDMRAQLYATLGSAYEQARIDQVRNTPVITVIAHPFVAARPDSRGLLVKGVIAMAFGLIVAIFIVMLQEIGQETRRQAPATAQEFQDLIQESWLDLRHPWKRVVSPEIGRWRQGRGT